MPRCADRTCRRWRPDLTGLERLVPQSARRRSALRFNGQWYCSRGCVEQAVRLDLDEQRTHSPVTGPALPPLRLGVLLQHAGVITQAELDAALLEKTRTGLRIGEQLERLGHARAEDVLRALAIQAGVSYLPAFDVSRVTQVSALLPAPMVRALGLVPFEMDEATQRLSVVCAAPLPKAAIRALARLTGWSPAVYFVTDRVFQAALDAYLSTSVAAHHAVTVNGLSAAAARVAEIVETQGAALTRHAECSDYMWVRIEAAQQISDLLVSGAHEGRECLVEHTPH